MKLITRLEEAILVAILRLKDDAYGVTINGEVSSSSQKKYSMGALYFSLDQLLRKGMVLKTVKQIYNEKGGRSRTYYTLSEMGIEALQDVRTYQRSLWKGISEKALGEKSE
ncbi:PadR family transcriptional regulator [Acidobacteriota bacterium]